MKFYKLLLFIIVITFNSEVIWAQKQNNQSHFDNFLNRKSTAFRLASGVPGPKYFQNTASYKIKATLNESKNTLRGHIQINYINNSPQDLDYIWMYVEQNRFTERSRGTLTTPIAGNRYSGDTDKGMHIRNFIAKSGRSKSSKYLINDTRMQVFFNTPIRAKGGKATISMDFNYKIPTKGMDRMGRLETKNGPIFTIAQWFPQVAVFDDIKGWNTEPYLGAGEFYYDFGNYDVSISVPYNHIVVSSGELKNPKEVLTTKIYQRYINAHQNDKTTYIIKPDEINTSSVHLKSSGMTTWKFSIKNAREFAFASSKAFIWDGARINLSGGKKSFANSVYPIESDGQEAWSRSTEYSKASIEDYSKRWYVYPYTTAVNVAANINGMEYPGLNFCHYKSKGDDLWGVTTHEFGHDWFPMIVSTNERHFPWMDEGFNTFINYYSALDFNNNEYPSKLASMKRYIPWLLSNNRESIDTFPDIVQIRNLGMTAYYKPAIGLLMLREYILGAERFDYAFRSYIKTWAYKHPQPEDFFNHIENAAGENLNWFWKGWFYSNGNIDLAIDGVVRNFEGNYMISLSNKGDIPMPVKLKITFQNGSSDNIDLPVEIWQRNNDWKYLYKTDKTIKAVVLDPNNMLADVNPNNQFWRAPNK